MPKIKITPIDYSTRTGKPISTVTRAIREKRALPGVLKVEKYGRFYLLIINVNEKGELI